ncbi:hypothetical protein [Amycolatopsis sp. BJA-103]|uniref:hypothetical protein n=1 Tax=unclassified Amycolatopsis TaxID=2618356 RepID=UPI000C794C41|nr:hypothetical protein [Amycolatopsis sp. BJA-103]AUI63928.1 hypothetical protein BKN51_41110 [Amycolatopsis sp. BJA-103]PNE15956.1 hypothetical protein B1H26_26990 [Amycolatopsis sp. BJA-103]
MEIIVANELGVRAVVLTLRAKGSALDFRLFPMVHIGTQAYFDTVRRQANECDVVVAEGVGDAKPVSRLTASYRLAARNKRLGLVVQDLKAGTFTVPTVRPDLDGPGFTEGWRRVPLGDRLMMSVLAPALGVFLRGFGTRGMLARFLTVDDEDDSWVESAEAMPEFDDLISVSRDKLLVDALAGLHEQRHHEPGTIGVVYGAEHMRAVVRELRARFGYVVRDAEYVTVFTL